MQYMALYQNGGSSSKATPQTGRTEFEILKASHRFLRDEDESKENSWDEQLAAKYYASLYREFAVCDLKHYKSGNFALRWRTESEVISGAGETTCGNTRCEHHSIPDHLAHTTTSPSLTTLELPFAYVERGENRSALVKVVLCPRCLNKLMWKRRKEKQEVLEQDAGLPNDQVDFSTSKSTEEVQQSRTDSGKVEMEEDDRKAAEGRRHGRHSADGDKYSRRRRSSRSRSPRRDPRTKGLGGHGWDGLRRRDTHILPFTGGEASELERTFS